MATDCSGATAIEYALIAGIITVATITAITTIGDRVSSMFASISFTP
ncbi:MAG TPA: Flp family type IVb pilin [Rhizomicrobium sp.]|nr:Flp family type IVb pilin [Rhizomicrobium sp.]